MDAKTKSLVNRKAEKLAELSALNALAESEDRDFTDDEKVKFDGIRADIEGLNARIERAQALEAATLDMPTVDVLEDAEISGGEPQIANDPRRGWSHFGEFAHALVAAGTPGQATYDDRLFIGAAPTTYGNEAVGSDGGFLVPPEFASTIRDYSLEDDALLPLTQNDIVSGNGMRLPVDETTPWGTDGIRAYWEGEAQQATQTKPKIESRELRLRKLFGLVPVTDELLADSSFASSYLPRKFGQSIRYKTNDAIMNGNGTGVPQGYLNSGAVVTQAKEGSQAADTIVAGNIAKMYSRCLDPTNAVWLINPDAFPQLVLLTIGDQPIWTPPSEGFKSAPNGFLLGRPVIMNESCQTIGDAGDIQFVSLRWYQTITKSQGIDFASSMHLYFDYDVTAFRAIFRADGQSVVRAPVTPPNSSVTRSPFVQLAART